MNGDNFSYLLMFYLLGAVFLTVPTQAEFTCSSLRDDHKCSKSITDNPDATDLFFSRIFLFGLFFYLDLYAPVGRWDFHGLSLARYCLPDSSFCALSPSALSPRSKSITDNPDATNLFFSRIFFIIIRINSITYLISNFLHITK